MYSLLTGCDKKFSGISLPLRSGCKIVIGNFMPRVISKGLRQDLPLGIHVALCWMGNILKIRCGA